MTVLLQDPKTRIRVLNDTFRRTFSGGKVVMTSGVDALPEMTKVAVLMAVQNHRRFTVENDPHGEHDFGSFEIAGEKCFWKIDYYDKSTEYGSEDPSDPQKTTRVLTIMLAEEY